MNSIIEFFEGVWDAVLDHAWIIPTGFVLGLALVAWHIIATGQPKSTYVISASDGLHYVNDFKWNEKQTCVVFEDIYQKRAVECGNFKIEAGKK